MSSQVLEYEADHAFEQTEFKQYRWTTLDEQKGFIEFLKSAKLSRYLDDGKLSWCASLFKKYKCASNPNHAKHTIYMPCGKRGVCPRCSMNYASKRACIMYNWIKRNLADKLDFDLKMNQIVLTLPKELHSDIDSKVFAKMIKSFMKSMGIEAYGRCVQERHSNNPLSSRYVHAHVLSLNVKQLDSKLAQSDYYFDVDNMRVIWKDKIREFTGVEVEGDVNVYTEYASVINDSKKIKHFLAYLYRYPVQDLFNVQIRNHSINYLEPTQFENAIKDDRYQPNTILQFDLASRINQLLVEPKTRLVWCGLLTSAKRELLQSLLGVGECIWQSLHSIKRDLELRALNCRDCECPLEKEPYETGEYKGDNEPI